MTLAFEAARTVSIFVITGIIIHLAARFSLGGADYKKAFAVSAVLVVLRTAIVYLGLPSVLAVLSIVVLAFISIQVAYQISSWKTFMIIAVTIIISLIFVMIVGSFLELLSRIEGKPPGF